MQENTINNEIDFKSLGNKKVLVVEDMELNQWLAKQILTSWGFEVVIVNNGYEALEVLAQNDFDCILMDVQMPEMDGIEATKQIRQLHDPLKASIPIIALTAHTLKENREKYVAAGMNDYVSKPINESKLFLAICRNFEKNSLTNSIDRKMETFHHKNGGTPSSGKKLYDLTMVESISGGDQAFIKKMVELFIHTVPQNVQELNNGLQTQNWDQVAKMAHKLKSTIDSMGITTIREDIRAVEANAKQKKHLHEMAVLIQKIQTVIGSCSEQLQADIN